MEEQYMSVVLVGLSILYSTLACIGSMGNCWVLLMLSGHLTGQDGRQMPSTPTATSQRSSGRREKTLARGAHTSTHVYLLVLSLADLTHVLSLPLLIVDIATGGWPLGSISCTAFIAIECLNKFLSPSILALLSADRYIAICRPALYWLREKRAAAAGLGLSALIATLYTTPVTILSGVSVITRNKNNSVLKCMTQFRGESAAYSWFDLTQIFVFYLCPLSLICLVYSAILRKIYMHTRYSTIGRRTTISLKRVVKCSAMVVAFYFICWTPYWFQRVFIREYLDLCPEGKNGTVPILNDTDCQQEAVLESDMGFVLGMYIVHALPYAQSAFNWLFYAYLNRQLRQSSRVLHTAPCTQPRMIEAEAGNSFLAIDILHHSDVSTLPMFSPRSSRSKCRPPFDLNPYSCVFRSKSSDLSDSVAMHTLSHPRNSFTNTHKLSVPSDFYHNGQALSVQNHRRNSSAVNGVSGTPMRRNYSAPRKNFLLEANGKSSDSVWL